jgi:hypothetical protein
LIGQQTKDGRVKNKERAIHGLLSIGFSYKQFAHIEALGNWGIPLSDIPVTAFSLNHDSRKTGPYVMPTPKHEREELTS